LRGRAKITLLLGSLGVLLVVIGFGYYKLGGFNSLQLELAEVNNYHLVGRSFEGSYQSDTVRYYFKEMKGYVEQELIDGNPVIIYDKEPEGQQGLARCFIGIKTEEETIIDSLEIRKITAKKCIRVSQDAHIAVIPTPEKIDKKIRAFAADNQLQLTGHNIEIYYPNNRMVIERPVFN